jgi:hypothetical protein
MSRQEFITQLEKILETDSLTEEEPIQPVTWDSIEILGTITLVDKAGKVVKIPDILGCRSVGDLLRLAGTH